MYLPWYEGIIVIKGEELITKYFIRDDSLFKVNITSENWSLHSGMKLYFILKSCIMKTLLVSFDSPRLEVYTCEYNVKAETK